MSAADEKFMHCALKEATIAYDADEVPVGAVVVRGPEVIGRGHNRREAFPDPTGHAEILALREAASALGSWRLEGCTLYATLEPCVMCAGALLHARVDRLVFGCLDPKGGGVRSLYRICEDERLNHRVVVQGGILEERCSSMLKDFFESLRRRRNCLGFE